MKLFCSLVSLSLCVCLCFCFLVGGVRSDFESNSISVGTSKIEQCQCWLFLCFICAVCELVVQHIKNHVSVVSVAIWSPQAKYPMSSCSPTTSWQLHLSFSSVIASHKSSLPQLCLCKNSTFHWSQIYSSWWFEILLKTFLYFWVKKR